VNIVATNAFLDFAYKLVPSTCFNESEDRDRERTQSYEKELKYFVEDCRIEAPSDTYIAMVIEETQMLK
jgi:hypothetical protein